MGISCWVCVNMWMQVVENCMKYETLAHYGRKFIKIFFTVFAYIFVYLLTDNEYGNRKIRVFFHTYRY